MTRLKLDDVGRVYQGAVPVHALRGVRLHVEPGDYLAIEGPSGSGKSTLLNQIALLDTPTSGRYTIDGVDTAALSDAERARLRSRTFSFIFQAFHLLDGRTVLDNVALGTLYRALPSSRRQEVAHEALEFVGLAGKADQRTSVLSGGERQRVAIARAITSGAPVIVADEPTGNLDQATGQQIMETLEGLHDRGATLIVVTHDAAVAARARRRLHVLDGEITETDNGQAAREESPSETRREKVAPVVQSDWDARSDPGGEETSSRVRLRDAVADAWKSLWTRTSRTMVLIASVALGVGLALTTAGMADTAQGQVSDIFDAQRNQRVGLSSGELTEHDQSPLLSQESLGRVSRVSGVRAASIFAHHGQASASAQLGHGDPHGSMRDIIGVVDGQISDLVARVETAGPPLRRLEQGEVIIGAQAAAEMSIGPLLASPVVWVGGSPRRVVGVLEDAGLQVTLLNAVLMTEPDAQEMGAPQWASVEVKVVPGAAPQVARQAPIAWNPAAPEGISVDAPPDPTVLRGEIESNVATMLLTLTGVALLAAVLSLTNAMTGAVFQRVGEFGLRRAIGARRVHVMGLVMVESLGVGLLGGVLGTYGAVLAVLGVTLARHWQPVLEPALLPLGVLGGAVVGVLGGLLATWKASRIEPADALRASR